MKRRPRPKRPQPGERTSRNPWRIVELLPDPHGRCRGYRSGHRRCIRQADVGWPGDLCRIHANRLARGVIRSVYGPAG